MNLNDLSLSLSLSNTKAYIYKQLYTWHLQLHSSIYYFSNKYVSMHFTYHQTNFLNCIYLDIYLKGIYFKSNIITLAL